MDSTVRATLRVAWVAWFMLAAPPIDARSTDTVWIDESLVDIVHIDPNAPRPVPTAIDASQIHSIHAIGRLYCRELHVDHLQGSRREDCTLGRVSSMTFRRKLGDTKDDGTEAFDLASVWCEGNNYMAGQQHRFQLVDTEAGECQQLCDLVPPDQKCIFPADIGRAARRAPDPFYDSMVVEIVSLPERRAPRCEGEAEHAEAWEVSVIEHRSTGLGGQPTLHQPLGKAPATLWVVCPEAERPAVGALIATRIAHGSMDACLPWAEDRRSSQGDVFCAPASWKPTEGLSVPLDSGP